MTDNLDFAFEEVLEGKDIILPKPGDYIDIYGNGEYQYTAYMTYKYSYSEKVENYLYDYYRIVMTMALTRTGKFVFPCSLVINSFAHKDYKWTFAPSSKENIEKINVFINKTKCI